ncbi:Protein of uncharacterised function (DUF2514) [Kluyvera cryocrescens]|uniref:Protein of uncharacterized function (DUF2514) n=1 Tax=Kluyvera cryocrescens TaxID=580 RepID=A0A485B6A8_KLUCR|nr:Protein of uncharacterised function (DUF2514) [Kluyvera cryocrescens]
MQEQTIIWAFVKANWIQLLIVVMLAALVAGVRIAWVNHGETQYAAGYGQAKIDQQEADAKLRSLNEKEKATNEREAQQRIDRARNDALDAAARAGRLQQQLVAIRDQLGQYNATVGAGRQPQTPEFCLPTCSANLSSETDNWQNTLTGQPKPEGSVNGSTTP